MAEVTAEWLFATVGEIRQLRSRSGDVAEDEDGGHAMGKQSVSLLPSLVELYSGNGNHTCCLSPHFIRVTAVEIEPRLCAAAYENFTVNGVENAVCRALPAEVFAREKTKNTLPHVKPSTSKTVKVRDGKRRESKEMVAEDEEKVEEVEREEEEDILACAGEHGVVLVDPPRAGLDLDTLALVRQFRSILYIACDARSLRRDLVERGLAVGRVVSARIIPIQFTLKMPNFFKKLQIIYLVRFPRKIPSTNLHP